MSVAMEIDSDCEDALAVCATLLGVIITHENQPKKRRMWSRKFLLKRETHGVYKSVLHELYIEDRQGFKNFVRMTSGQFEELLRLVAPHIHRKDTNFRAAVSPAEQLLVTLRFLATGDSYTSLMYSHRISLAKISETVPRVCWIIVNVLKNFVKEPSTKEEWEEVSNGFETIWNFPHCIGAIDGRHIEIVQPAGTGSLYYNYTGTFSVVLLALVNAHYNVISYEVGMQGSISDGGVFNCSKMGEKFAEGKLDLPTPRPLPGRNEVVPFVMVGDDAFALSEYMMKPYAGWQEKGSLERVFNYRLSRSRRIVENFFGILTAVFRCLRTTMHLSPEKATLVTSAAVSLHNFLRRNKESATVYTPPGSFDLEDPETGKVSDGSWRMTPQNKSLQRKGGNAGRTAKNIRDEFAIYFASDVGKVKWQEKYA